MGSDSDIALGIYYTLNGIAMLFMSVHLILYIKNIVGTSGFMSLILLLLSYWVAGIVGALYIGNTLDLLLDVIL